VSYPAPGIPVKAGTYQKSGVVSSSTYLRHGRGQPLSLTQSVGGEIP
jgi:hypothetical protein